MEIHVLLEPSPAGGFRARSGDPLNLTAEGVTPDAALHHFRDLIVDRITVCSRLTTLQIPTSTETEHHLGEGMYRDDPLYEDWRAEVENYRRQIEEDPDIP